MLNSVGSIVNFEMWPYGNAQETQYNSTYWHFTCQHGTSECIGNMYEACAIEHYNGTDANSVPFWWPFVYCLEKSGSAGSLSTAQNCAKNNKIDWSVIDACAGPEPQYGSYNDGNPLMHGIALDTKNLNPPHQFTPWVIINGVPLTSAQISMSLTRLVCNAYTGTPPAGCSSFKESEPTKYEISLRSEKLV